MARVQSVWVPRTPSKTSGWAFAEGHPRGKMGHGIVLLVSGCPRPSCGCFSCAGCAVPAAQCRLRRAGCAVPAAPCRTGRAGDRGRHVRPEVLVLRRQITRPALRPADRAVFAGSSRLMSKVHRGGSSFSPRRCSAGIEISSVAGRVRANTLRVVVLDLKSFFTVADKDPTEVVATDVFDFLAHQRGGRKVVRLVDGETRLEVGSLASIGVATVKLAEVGLPRQMADGVADLVAQGQRRRPSGTTRADRVTDGDIDGTPPWKAPAGAHDVPAPSDANRDDRATSGDGRGERPQVEWTDPGRPVEGSLGKVHESAPPLEYVVQPGGVCGHQLRVRPVNELASEPSQEGPGNGLGGEFIP